MKTAIVYSGQGAQYAGMGKDLYEQYDSVKEVFAQASDTLQLDMAALCFEENDLNGREWCLAFSTSDVVGLSSIIMQFTLELTRLPTYSINHGDSRFVGKITNIVLAYRRCRQIARQQLPIKIEPRCGDTADFHWSFSQLTVLPNR